MSVIAVIERQELVLSEFCRECADWLPAGRERLLFVDGWDDHPPDRRVNFESIRRGFGAPLSLPEAPGHLFSSTKSDDTSYDDRPPSDLGEEAAAMWLTFRVR